MPRHPYSHIDTWPDATVEDAAQSAADRGWTRTLGFAALAINAIWFGAHWLVWAVQS